MIWPNLRHLRLFCEAVRLGSLSDAAGVINVSQPAASQAIGRLEDALGARLLVRSDAGVEPTAEGELARLRARRALDLLGAATLPAGRRGRHQLPVGLTTTHVRAISAYAEGGSFTAAAALLGTSEPAVQRAARGLETLLGAPLFEGRGRLMRLSPRGVSVARAARLALNEIENARVEILGLHDRVEGTVRIGTLPLVRTTVVPEVIARLTRDYPNARFSIAEGRYEDLMADLEMGRIDILIGAMRKRFDTRLFAQERLFDYRLSVVARSGHPLAGRREVDFAELAAYPWITAREGSPARRTFREASLAGPEGLALRGTVETGSLVAARGILLRSDHLALLSSHQIRYELETGLLVRLAYDLGDPGKSVGATTRRRWLPTSLHEAFIATLREVVRGEMIDQCQGVSTEV